MTQTPQAQGHEKAKGRQIGQAIPVHGQRPELERDRVDGGMRQHGAIVPVFAAPVRPPAEG